MDEALGVLILAFVCLFIIIGVSNKKSPVVIKPKPVTLRPTIINETILKNAKPRPVPPNVSAKTQHTSLIGFLNSYSNEPPDNTTTLM